MYNTMIYARARRGLIVIGRQRSGENIQTVASTLKSKMGENGKRVFDETSWPSDWGDVPTSQEIKDAALVGVKQLSKERFLKHFNAEVDQLQADIVAEFALSDDQVEKLDELFDSVFK
jgi:hypothetical protein